MLFSRRTIGYSLIPYFLFLSCLGGINPKTNPAADPSAVNRDWNLAENAHTECPERCRCEKTKATCKGSSITAVPSGLPSRITKLFLTETHIATIAVDAFVNLTQLQELSIRDAPKLESIHPGAFDVLGKLKILHIYDCSRLETIEKGVFAEFKSLNMLDLSNNYFEEIASHAFSKLKIYDLIIEGTRIRRVRDRAFYGAQIVSLYLKGNPFLTQIDEEAFTNIHELQALDLSGTAISHLPINGLKDIEELFLTKTESLRIFPSVYSFSKIRKAYLTYPHHCCAFQNPDIQDPTKYEEFQRSVQCPQTTPFSNELATTEDARDLLASFDDPSAKNNRVGINRQKRENPSSWGYLTRLRRFFEQPSHDDTRTGKFGDFDTEIQEKDIYKGFGPIQTESSVHVKPNIGDNDWVLHVGPTLSVNESYSQFVLCGKVAKDYREVVCTPKPDALNPCEDVMGYHWLRIIVWFVLLAAIVGNSIVIFVLLTTKVKMSVTKFLMCNLAFGDLLMGVYLLLLASIDAKTLGVYFNYAISWQTEGGCQAAGFLTVLSSELSIYTLTVITMERWYAISHAIHLTKRLKLRQAAIIMAIGWIYSFVMAILPFVGVSGYGTVSICLPMKLETKIDLAYVLSLLIVNGLAFVAICVCYTSMYYHVKGNDNSIRNGDATIAKRMALLVFTNFACWAPIAFFGLTASAGWPLIDITNSKILLVFFYPLNSCANPFLYAIFTKHFRRDLFILLSKYGICTRRANVYKGTFSKSVTTTRNTHQMHNPLTTTVSNDSSLPQASEGFLSRMSSTGSRHVPSKCSCGYGSPKPSPASTIVDDDSRKLSMVREIGYTGDPKGKKVTSSTLCDCSEHDHIHLSPRRFCGIYEKRGSNDAT